MSLVDAEIFSVLDDLYVRVKDVMKVMRVYVKQQETQHEDLRETS